VRGGEQHLVSGVMTVGAVDRPEVAEVDVEQADVWVAGVARAANKRLGERFCEHQPVG